LEIFSLQLTQSAADDLTDIPNHLRKGILNTIQLLSSNPFPLGTHIKRLKGFKPSHYRLRSADYRGLYYVPGRTITIMRIIDRKDLERTIKRLKL